MHSFCFEATDSFKKEMAPIIPLGLSIERK